MRLPFPERVSLFRVFVFCMFLCPLQVLEGTSPVFTLCTFCSLFTTALAFNLAGGFSRPSGGFVAAYTVLGALFAIFWKVLINEPGQSNLLQPERTIEVFLGSTVALLAAVYLSKKLRFNKTFARFRSEEDMYRASVGSILLGTFGMVYSSYKMGSPAAGLVGVAQALTQFMTLGIVLGVFYEVRNSQGRKSMNGLIAFACFLSFATGVMQYSKQGMFTPLVAWLIPAAAGRYKINLVQIGILTSAAVFMVTYLVPYSQNGRVYSSPTATFSETMRVNIFLLNHLEELRRIGTGPVAAFREDDNRNFYDTPQGFADRLQMLSPDDAIINEAETTGTFGLFPTLFAFENLIPHFIWPEKPTQGFGNVYAHLVGMVTDDEDTTTGVSFSAGGDAYFQDEWVGVFIVLPVLLTLTFMLCDSLGGDTRQSPFALLIMIGFMHTAPEGMVAGLVGDCTFVVAGIFVLSFITANVIPLFANLVIGPPRKKFGESTVFTAIPGRFAGGTAPAQEVEQS